MLSVCVLSRDDFGTLDAQQITVRPTSRAIYFCNGFGRMRNGNKSLRWWDVKSITAGAPFASEKSCTSNEFDTAAEIVADV